MLDGLVAALAEPWRNGDGSVNAGRCWHPSQCPAEALLLMSSNHPRFGKDMPLCHHHAQLYATSVVTAAFEDERGNTNVVIYPLP